MIDEKEKELLEEFEKVKDELNEITEYMKSQETKIISLTTQYETYKKIFDTLKIEYTKLPDMEFF